MATALQFARFLDKELRVQDFADASHNGLQVQNTGRVRRIACGVDASLEFFEKAKEEGAQFLVCHHGLSWGDSLRRITGLNFEKISFLVRNNMALYACHLPLDAHPRYGNNVLICKALGLRNLRKFGRYNGVPIGFRGSLPRAMRLERFVQTVQKAVGNDVQLMPFGPPTVRTVGVVSGGAADEIAEAGELGLDAYVSGEPKLVAYNLAREHGIHGLFAGHYATETFGVKAIGSLLERKYGVPATFVDLGIRF